MLKTSKTYKYFGYFCLYLGPIAAVTIRNESIIQAGLLTFVTVSTVMFGSHCIKKSEAIIRELTIKSRLDEESLGALIKLNGLMFTKEELKEKFNIEVSIQTIRYLIQQDIIKNEVFSLSADGKITYGYYLTAFGKDVLRKHIGIIHLFPDIIIDMYRTAYWLGHKKDFPNKKRDFKNDQKKEFDDCINSFFENIPKEFIKLENNISYEKKIDIFRKFLENQESSYDDKMKIINKWKA